MQLYYSGEALKNCKQYLFFFSFLFILCRLHIIFIKICDNNMIFYCFNKYLYYRALNFEKHFPF